MPISKSISAQPVAVPHRAGDRVVLSIKGLRKAFGGQVVLDDVDADLKEGEVVLLRGDNGSGKTTLLNILTGNLEPDAGTIHLRTNGEEETFRFPRNWWEGLNPFDHFTPERVGAEGVGRTWQDVRLFPTLTLLDNIAVARPRQPAENPLRALFSRSRTSPESDNRQASTALLVDLKLGGREQSSGDKISLGQSKRVAIARAVRAGARILFLDEPLSGLDAAGIDEVLGLLASLARNERLTLVIVEHTFNIPRVLDFASTVWILRAGRIAVQTPPEARTNYSADAGDGTVALIARHLGNGYQREDTPLNRGAMLTRFFPTGASADRPVLLEVCNLVVRRGPRLVVGQEDSSGSVTGLCFTLREGDIAILQAPNGWGKSSLFATICGIISAEDGTIHLQAEPLDALPVWERVQKGLRALLSEAHPFSGLRTKEVIKLAGCLDTGFNLAPLSDRRCSSLSGGELKRVSLGGLLQGKLGLFDEPFRALDNDGAKEALLRLISCCRTVCIAEPQPHA